MSETAGDFWGIVSNLPHDALAGDQLDASMVNQIARDEDVQAAVSNIMEIAADDRAFYPEAKDILARHIMLAYHMNSPELGERVVSVAEAMLEEKGRYGQA